MIEISPEKHKENQQRRVNVLKTHCLNILKLEGFSKFQEKLENNQAPIPKEGIDDVFLNAIKEEIELLLNKIEYEEEINGIEYTNLETLNIFLENKNNVLNYKLTGIYKNGRVSFLPIMLTSEAIMPLSENIQGSIPFKYFNLKILLMLLIILTTYEELGIDIIRKAKEKLSEEQYTHLLKRKYPEILAIDSSILSNGNKKRIRRIIQRIAKYFSEVKISISSENIIRVKFISPSKILRIKFIPKDYYFGESLGGGFAKNSFEIDFGDWKNRVKSVSQLIKYLY